MTGRLKEQQEALKHETGTSKALFTTLVTVAGLAHNAHWNEIQNEIRLDDLFEN